MKTNNVRKSLSLVLALLLFCSCFIITSTTNASFSEEDAVYFEKVKHSNDMVFNFWDYFTDYDAEAFLPPDYFSGFEMNSNGTLTIYVTDDTDEIINEISRVCKSRDYSIVKVQYSFNALYGLLDSIKESNDSSLIDSISFDLSENKVVACVKSENIDRLSIKQNSMLVIKKSEEIKPAASIKYDGANSHNLIDSNNTRQINSTTFYPGMQTSFNNNMSTGTVGFCATDGQGRKILITHAHSYGFTEPYYAQNVSVGGTSMSAYTLSTASGSTEDQFFDAAYIVIPSALSSVSLSNKIGNQSTVRLSYVAYDAYLSSYNNMVVNAYGSASGFIVGSSLNPITATVQYIPYEQLWDLSMSHNTQNGDSGGPIYLTGSNQNRLLGIIRTTYGAGVLWKNIRDRYYALTGFTLTPYTSNT